MNVGRNRAIFVTVSKGNTTETFFRVANVFHLFSGSAEKPTHIRFLVSKTLAGSVIGKGGSTITEFQEKSGAQILLSRNRQYFPGTTDRIVVISGTIKEVFTAVELILGKLHSDVI